MEKRRSERLPVVTDVMIGYRSMGLVKGQTRDISLGGMCVETGGLNLPVNAPVTVQFKLHSPLGKSDCEAHAVVMRTDEFSSCLMFDGMEPNTHQALRSLVGDWQILPDRHEVSHALAG